MRLHLFLVIISATMATAQTYDPGGGPSILSRGGNAGTRGTEPAVLTFSAGVTGIYDNSLGALSLTSNGIAKQEAGEGLEASATLFGVHQWKRSSLGVSYAGSYAEYVGNSLYNGTTQSLSLNYSTQHSKRLSTKYSLAAGSSNRPYGGIGGLYGGGGVAGQNILDPNFLAVPSQEFFNNRVDYVQGAVGFVYHKSNRLSFGSFSPIAL